MTTADNLRKSAKRWLKSIREGDSEARARLAHAYPGAPAQPTLRDVQHALACERGHESWAALMRVAADATLEDPLGLTPLDHAALTGDVDMTRRLLDAGAVLTLPAAIVLERAEDIDRLVRERPDSVSMTSERWWACVLALASRRAPGRVIEALLATLMRTARAFRSSTLKSTTTATSKGWPDIRRCMRPRFTATTRRWR